MNPIFREITQCRVCGNTELIPILSLGNQSLTGVFPKSKEQNVPSGPLELVKCADHGQNQYCGLVQLKHTYDSQALYGEGYGYRSSLNKSMVRHLQAKVKTIVEQDILRPGDLILDIGSNDGTLLKAYPSQEWTLAGIDPSAKDLRKYYPSHIDLHTDFFSSALVTSAYPSQKAKVITSIAMFYDLDDPLAFMRQIRDVLDDDGVWILEQSYMPTMLERLAYDTVCHEHLEYYGLKQICWMAEEVGLHVLDVHLNDVNGGSFEVTLSRNRRAQKTRKAYISTLLLKEEEMGLSSDMVLFEKFEHAVSEHAKELRRIVDQINCDGKKIIGYGASTKGNVLLQFCQFTEKDIPFIAEVNEDKFHSFTPGTHIPIVSEEEAKAHHPDYMLVLPWHFKENIVSREQVYLQNQGTLLFPLPKIEMVHQSSKLEPAYL